MRSYCVDLINLIMIKNSLYTFYLYPSRFHLTSLSAGEKVFSYLKLLIFNWLCMIAFGVLVTTLLVNLGVMDEPVISSHKNILKWNLIVLSGFVAPILEEIIFRNWLIFRVRNISLAIGTFFGVIIYKFFFYTHAADVRKEMFGAILSVVVSVCIFIACYIYLRKINFDLSIFFKANTRCLSIASSVLFAYIHIFNYQITPNFLLFSPLILINYFIGGLILSYIRVRDGFFYACAFHCIYNLVFLLLKFR